MTKKPITWTSIELIDGKLYVCTWFKADSFAERRCTAMVLHRSER